MVEMQAMLQVITQAAIQAASPVVKAITKVADPAEGSVRLNAVGNAGSKAGGSQFKYPTFSISAKDK